MLNFFSSALFSILLIIIFIFILIVFFFYRFQDRFIFRPYSMIERTPSDIDIVFKNLKIKTQDSVNLHAWYIERKHPKGVILFCHGNGGNISHRLDRIELLKKNGYSILLFDYRGYGQSEGKPDEKGLYTDVLSCYQYLVRNLKVKKEDIIIWGCSLGGAVASYLASQKECRFLLLESSFTNLREMSKKLYPFFPANSLLKYSFDTEKHLKATDVPVLVMHSADDDLVPFSMGRKLFESATGMKDFLAIKGSHNDSFYLSRFDVLDKLEEFNQRLK